MRHPFGIIAGMSTRRRPQVAGQLSLPDLDLPVSPQPTRFHLDMATRRRGLAHIAEIRRQAALRHQLHTAA